MKINIESNYVELTPESSEETSSLEQLWKMVVDCVRFNKKLVPMGLFQPPEKNVARFAIEGLEEKQQAAPLPEAHVDHDCRCYCQTCNKYIDLKKGDRIPLCCGKLMEIMD